MEKLSSEFFSQVVFKSRYYEPPPSQKKKKKSLEVARCLREAPDQCEQNKTLPTCRRDGGIEGGKEEEVGPTATAEWKEKIQAASAGSCLRRKHQQETRRTM